MPSRSSPMALVINRVSTLVLGGFRVQAIRSTSTIWSHSPKASYRHGWELDFEKEMRRLKTFRWWILLPLLFIFLVPAWVWLGDFLGYDLFIAPDPSPPRYSSELLGSFFYIIWYGLALFVVLPAMLLSIPFGIFVTGQGRIAIGVILVSLFYSAILFWLRWAYASDRRESQQKRNNA